MYTTCTTDEILIKIHETFRICKKIEKIDETFVICEIENAIEKTIHILISSNNYFSFQRIQ